MKQTNQNNFLDSEELYVSTDDNGTGETGGNDPHVSEVEKTEEQNPRPWAEVPKGGTVTTGENKEQKEEEEKAEETKPKPWE